MKRSTFELGEFQKCVHWQDILFVLRLCEALYWVEDTEQIEFCNHEAKNLREPDVKRRLKLEGNVRIDFP